MPLFLIERSFADRLELDQPTLKLIDKVNADIGVEWLYSFLSADRKKTYCLYQAPSAAAIRSAAKRLNIPADVIIEVSEIGPRVAAAS